MRNFDLSNYSNEITHDDYIIELINSLIEEAIEKTISDIHIEPQQQTCRIRFRRDGLLYEAASLPSHFSSRMATRIKVMANLNIAERRLPQDGRIYIAEKNNMDLRVNICPTLFGEKIALRLLDTKHNQLNLANLGMENEQLTLFLHTLTKPQGLILVTGPTGSGKTLTLYAALQYLNQIEKHICTIEDPIEISLPGINQIQVNPKINLDFANGLRALLRQDPDVIMIGEIRDKETAEIAIQAAQTGHLVLSTLHTTQAKETLIRLQTMGINESELRHSLSLIINQRLVRLLCSQCKQSDNNVFHAKGCPICYQGYQGRTGVFEILTTTNPSLNLRQAAMLKIKNGLTTHNEYLRVIGHE